MNPYRPPHTPTQLDTGRRIALAALAHPRGYTLAQAADIARCYVNHTPTLKEYRHA